MTIDGRIEALMSMPTGISVSATSNAGGPTTVNLTAGNYYWTAAGGVSSLLTHFASVLNAQRPITGGTWQVTMSTGANGTGQVTISSSNASNISITWTSTVLRDVLGFTANISAVTTATGAKQAKALWRPECPLQLKGAIKRAPIVSDKRVSISPRGDVTAFVGNTLRRQRDLVYTHVPLARVWEAEAVLGNASFEQFVIDTQIQQGATGWFSPVSKVQVYDHNGNQMGIDIGGGGVGGWQAIDLPELDALAKVNPSWDGMWTINIPTLVSSG